MYSRYGSSDYNAKIFCNQEVKGDLLIRVLHRTLPGTSPTLLFRVQVHSSFLKTPSHQFRYADLDNTTAGPLNDNRFPSHFTFTLHFEEESPFDAVPSTQSPDRRSIMITPATLDPSVTRRHSAPPRKQNVNVEPKPSSKPPLSNSVHRSVPDVSTSPIVDRSKKPKTRSFPNTQNSSFAGQINHAPDLVPVNRGNYEPLPKASSTQHIAPLSTPSPFSSASRNISSASPVAVAQQTKLPPLLQVYDTTELGSSAGRATNLHVQSAPTHKRSLSHSEYMKFNQKANSQPPKRTIVTPQPSSSSLHQTPLSSPSPNWTSLPTVNITPANRTSAPKQTNFAPPTNSSEMDAFRERMKNLLN
mgnify:CR=1 FL=1